MILRNFARLARTPKRRAALRIIEAGMDAVMVKNVMRKNVTRKGSVLRIMGRAYDLKKYENVYVVGFGKASISCARELERTLGARIRAGVVLDVSFAKLRRIKVRKCTHPVLSAQNVRHTRELLALLRRATEHDLVICTVSGGGSAILESPAVPLREFIRMNKALLHAGEDIHAMNTVRKHLSLVKGGQLPGYAHGATFVSLILSDVIGDDTSFIASGPTVHDRTSAADARKIVKKYRLPHEHLRETPFTLPPHVHNHLILTNKTAVEAMAREARRLKLTPRVLTTREKGEARIVGAKLAKTAKKGVALIAAGETTVTVRGHGKGGRNQEVCLGALKNIGDAVVASAGTDGIDNTPAAGAVVDKSTLATLPDYLTYLDSNNAFAALKKSGDLILTGPTGTNVADIMVVVK